MIELHDHVGAKVALDLHDRLGRETPFGTVDVTSEFDAVLVHAAQAFQRKDLEATRVGEDGTVPGHEPVKSAEVSNDIVPGPQVQVVSIGEDDFGAGGEGPLSSRFSGRAWG
jgi:hypothetical protein